MNRQICANIYPSKKKKKIIDTDKEWSTHKYITLEIIRIFIHQQ